jgi:hypothetical protein
LDYPSCPTHGVGGTQASQTVRASSIRYGVSSPRRPRQLFLCRYELQGGLAGQHRFTEPIPRLMSPTGVCPDCGQPTDAWTGEQVFPNYQFTAQPIADALVRLADGRAYREAATGLRGAVSNHLGTVRPSLSREPHIIQRLTEVLAPLFHDALAPETKVWPEGGLIAVDAIRFNLLGRHKYDLEGTRTPVEHTTPDLLEMLDPDESEDQIARKALEKLLPPGEIYRKGLQGGVANWQILGAYGYLLNSKGEIPRTDGAGQPWLFRSYHGADALAWAHFFRHLPGTPAYVLSDMAPAIAMGVELAWPDLATRPQLLICEYHAIEALKARIPGEPELQEEAGRLFLTHGRWIDGVYDKDLPNGEVGSISRLWHFARFRRLAREAKIFNFDRLFATPTWRRVLAQVVNKDWKLRYSTGALEAQLYSLGDRQIAWRAGNMANRARTDDLLLLLHLGMLQRATSANFLRVVEHWLRHNPRLPRQRRETDPKGQLSSLRRPLTDQELQAVGLMTTTQFQAWQKKRRNHLMYLRRKRTAQLSPEVRELLSQRRLARRHRNDPQNLAHKRWYQEHRQEEIQKATTRKAAARAKISLAPTSPKEITNAK